jgi:cytochrome d ubiquinol oxidase subunit II
MVVVSAIAGLGTLALVRADRFEPARASAALAVAAIIAGWAVAQQPWILPELTIGQAAADRATLIALVIAVSVGAIVLIPSLLLLFGLRLRGRFDPGPVGGAVPRPTGRAPTAQGRTRRRTLAVGTSIAGLGLGAALLVLTDSGQVHAVALTCLAIAGASTFVQAATVPPVG